MSAADAPAVPGRVLVVCYEYPPLGGGGGVMVRDLVGELARRGVGATVLTSRAGGLPEREADGALAIVRVPVWGREEVPVASLPSMLSFFPSSLRAGRRLLRAQPFDLVHSVFAIPSAPSGVLLARGAGLPHVLSVLGGDVFDPTKRLSPHRTPLLKQTVRWTMRASDVVVAESRDLMERAREIYGIEGVRRIPLAVRPVPFARVRRAELGLPDDAVVLATVGRLVARKGLDRLLEIVAGSGDRRLLLVVMGDGPLAAPLREQAARLGIAERVRFEGFVSEARKWQLLAASDVYVSTSVHEGFGIVFLEAMESGLPVVAYDCGGQTDFLGPDFSRVLHLGDEAGFGAALAELAGDAALRARMGAAARRAAAGFHVGPLAERYLEVHREVLAACAPAGAASRAARPAAGERA